MIIIVEGIDRVGKTTLVNRIHMETNYPVYRHVGDRDFTKVQNEVETDKFLQLIEMCKITHSTVIFDRFHWSDFVYGSVQRHYDFTTALKNKDKIESVLKEQGAIIILVCPTDIERSSYEHGIDLHRHEHLFQFAFSESKIDKFICTYETINEAALWVKDKIKKDVSEDKSC